MSLYGYIYKIICNIDSNIIYIGSTQHIKNRWKQHIYDYNNNKKNNISIYNYFDKYGINNFSIIKIKKYFICDNKHLQAYEQLWINKTNKLCINKNNSLKLYFGEYIKYNKIIKKNKVNILVENIKKVKINDTPENNLFNFINDIIEKMKLENKVKTNYKKKYITIKDIKNEIKKTVYYNCNLKYFKSINIKQKIINYIPPEKFKCRYNYIRNVYIID